MTHEESVARHPATFVERMRERYGVTHVPEPELPSEDTAAIDAINRALAWTDPETGL